MQGALLDRGWPISIKAEAIICRLLDHLTLQISGGGGIQMGIGCIALGTAGSCFLKKAIIRIESRMQKHNRLMYSFFLSLFQNLKNQIMTTNLWVEQVSRFF